MNEDKLTVHLIDDDSETLILLFEALSQAGFQASASSEALEGLAFVTRYRPRAVICALEIPCMGGIEMIRRIRRVSPDTKVFLLSSWMNGTLKERVEEQGALGVILKPCAEADVIGELDRLFHVTPGQS